MKVGDLVKLKRPVTKDFNKAYLVTEFAEPTIKQCVKFLGHFGWHRTADYEVVK